MGFPGRSDSKEPACNAGDPSLISRSGRSPGGGHGYPLQCSCLGNPMDTEAWRAAVHGVTESQTRLNSSSRSQLEKGRDETEFQLNGC